MIENLELLGGLEKMKFILSQRLSPLEFIMILKCYQNL
jgi:hypothetical protein